MMTVTAAGPGLLPQASGRTQRSGRWPFPEGHEVLEHCESGGTEAGPVPGAAPGTAALETFEAFAERHRLHVGAPGGDGRDSWGAHVACAKWKGEVAGRAGVARDPGAEATSFALLPRAAAVRALLEATREGRVLQRTVPCCRERFLVFADLVVVQVRRGRDHPITLVACRATRPDDVASTMGSLLAESGDALVPLDAKGMPARPADLPWTARIGEEAAVDALDDLLTLWRIEDPAVRRLELVASARDGRTPGPPGTTVRAFTESAGGISTACGHGGVADRVVGTLAADLEAAIGAEGWHCRCVTERPWRASSWERVPLRVASRRLEEEVDSAALRAAAKASGPRRAQEAARRLLDLLAGMREAAGS